MRANSVKDKHLKLDQSKIERVKLVLHARTETEAIEQALDMVIAGETEMQRRRDAAGRILARRKHIPPVKGDVAAWVREGRREREAARG